MRKRIAAVIMVLALVALSVGWLRKQRGTGPVATAAADHSSPVSLGPTTEPHPEGPVSDSSAPALPTGATSRVAQRTDDGHSAPPMFEATLLTNGMVNDRVHEALKSADFDDFILSLQAANTPGAGERNTAYRIELEDALRRIPELGSLGRFACGHTFCAGTIRIGKDRNAFDSWIRTFQEQATLPVPTLSHRTILAPDGSPEARLVFTTRGAGGFMSSGKRP